MPEAKAVAWAFTDV